MNKKLKEVYIRLISRQFFDLVEEEKIKTFEEFSFKFGLLPNGKWEFSIADNDSFTMYLQVDLDDEPEMLIFHDLLTDEIHKISFSDATIEEIQERVKKKLKDLIKK